VKPTHRVTRTIAICFGQFGPYHHARVAALQKLAHEQGIRALPVQIAAFTTTYEWKSERGAGSGEQGARSEEPSRFSRQDSLSQAQDLRTLCKAADEAASPLDVFFRVRNLFREEKVDVAFVPSYSPARYLSFTLAARSLGIRTVMMNDSHAGTEQATCWKKWIKRQIVKRFDAALVAGQPQKRHFASLGIPAEKIFTGYDAVDNDFFARRADEIRAGAKKRVQCSVSSFQQELKADEVRTPSSPRSQSGERRTGLKAEFEA
jgi:1,2-diacylglycerol 3-alpha-glucosyltransferase